jgi:hypothetical protein
MLTTSLGETPRSWTVTGVALEGRAPSRITIAVIRRGLMILFILVIALCGVPRFIMPG